MVEEGGDGGGGGGAALADGGGEGEGGAAAAEGGSGEQVGGIDSGLSGAQGPNSQQVAGDVTPPSLASQIFNPSGSLADNYEAVMTENGMESAIPYFGRDGFGGKQDSILKGLSNLVVLQGKKVENFTREEMSMLTEGEQATMRGNLMDIPEAPGDYNIREMEQFKDAELNDEFVEYWEDAAHELGATKEMVEKFFEKNTDWSTKFQEAQGKANETATAEHKAEVKEHFEKEWGADFAKNKDLTDTWADQNMDPSDPYDVATLNNKKGLERIYRLAKAEDEGRAEGSMPKLGGDGNKGGAGTYGDQFDSFINANPSWQKSPELLAEGNRLASLGDKAEKRGG